MIRNILFAAANSSWTPLELFKNGEQGIWLDASDYSTLFQDSGGTTQVTSTSQPVGLWQDKSGNGNHLLQSTSAHRPITTTISGKQYILFDGVDDDLVRTTGTISGTDGISGCAGVYAQSLSGGSSNTFFGWGGNLEFRLASSTTVSAKPLGTAITSSVSMTLPRSLVILSYAKQSVTNATITFGGTTTTGSTVSTSPGTSNIAMPTVSSVGSVRTGQIIVVNRQLTATEKQQLIDYVSSKA